MLSSDRGEKLWQYWQQQLAGELPRLNLPTDRPRPAVPTYDFASDSVQINAEIIQKLHGLAVAENTTLYTILLATFFVQLYRYSGQEDILVGTPISGRNKAEESEIIGDLENLVVIRACLANRPTFKELLAQVDGTVTAAREHLDYPFTLLVERLKAERDSSRSPIFQGAFNWHKFQRDELGQYLALGSYLIGGDRSTRGIDLNLEIIESDPPLPPRTNKIYSAGSPRSSGGGGGIKGGDRGINLLLDRGIQAVWQYNTDLFDESSIARMAGHFQKLLESIVATPEQSVPELPLLTEKERHQLLVEWNDTAVDYPQDKCIHQLFEEQVEKTPDAVAVIFEGQELTYEELNNRANKLAHYLRNLGVGPEVLVGICVERSLEMVVGLLGILKAGGAYVPLDPNYPQERLNYMLEDSAVPVLLTQKRLVEKLPKTQAKVVFLDTDWVAVSDAMPKGFIASESAENLGHSTSTDNLMYVIYTSGSTGKPKGVMQVHQGVVNRLLWMQKTYQMTQSDRFLQKTPFSFDVSVWEFFCPLLIGASLVIAKPGGHQDSVYLANLIASEQISTVHFVPSMLQVFLEQPQLDRCRYLKRVICSGEALAAKLQQRFFANLNSELHNLYGPTEAAIDVTNGQCQAEIQREIVPIGRPISNVQIYIIDKFWQPLPIGVPGELHIGGDGLARGYLNRPELTDQKFIPNPFSDEPGSRLYKTGDLARYLPDGNIEFLGRIDNQVKIRGFRIELGEIEAVLAQHPDVRESVVIAREDIPGDKRLVAYLTTDGEKPTINDLRAFLKTKLPDYMVPSALVLLEAMPLTPNGKIDRRALPAPDISTLANETSFVAPRDSFELQLTQIWSEVLGVSPIGVHDNFFDLGGHSLLAVRLMAEIEKQFGKNLSLAALFQGATIEQLAILLHQQTDTKSWSPTVAIQPQGEQPPFFCMPGSGGNVVHFHQLARHLGTDRPFYALQPPSLDGVTEPFTRVEEVAAYYLKAIQTVQPKGPYFLGGHSFGVLVAFEMAGQLQQQGETVARLALLDLPARLPGSPPKQLDWDDTRWMTNIAYILEVLSGKKLNISYEILKPLTAEAQLKYLKQQMETVNLLPPYSAIERVRGIVETIKADELAFMSYLPQSGYQGRITLFRTSEIYRDDLGMLGEIPRDTTWGWNHFSTQPVEVHVVPGNHTTMLSEPHVQVLAEKLKFCLAQEKLDEQ